MTRLRRNLLGVAALALVAGVTIRAYGSAMTLVQQVGRAFSVAAIEIGRGSVVRFTNEDIFDHQIFIDTPNFKFHSAEQPPGAVTDVAFPLEGTFDVRCEIHPRMHLTITVK